MKEWYGDTSNKKWSIECIIENNMDGTKEGLEKRLSQFFGHIGLMNFDKCREILVIRNLFHNYNYE